MADAVPKIDISRMYCVFVLAHFLGVDIFTSSIAGVVNASYRFTNSATKSILVWMS